MIKHILKLIWKKKASNALLLLEIFLSFLVLFAVISYINLNVDKLSKPMGFKTVDKWQIALPNFRDQDSLEVATKFTNLKQALLTMDRVKDVAFTNYGPFTNSISSSSFDDNGFKMRCKYVYSDEDLSKTLDIELIKGRWFTKEDLYAKYDPIIVDRTFMEEYYPNVNMVDSVFLFMGEKKIVGVMESYKYLGQFDDRYHTSILFEPSTSRENRYVELAMHPGTTAAYEEKINKVVADVLKSTSFIISNLEKTKKHAYLDTYIMMYALLGICGFLCINVALGLFGVLWYSINKRKSEIGLRRALGAHSTDIKKQFILEILILAGLAIVMGIIFAIQIPILKLTELEDVYYYNSIITSTIIILVLVVICAYFPSVMAAKMAPAKVLHEN